MRARTPLPVLVLAVVAALLIGSVGSATASGLTARSVKKIATKVVKKSAPRLSVAHAAAADSATNATNLGGRAPDAYLGRAAFATRGTVNTTVGGGAAVSGPLSITVPADDHFVHLSSGVQYNGAVGNMVEWWVVDGTCANLSGYTAFPVRSQIGNNSVNTTQTSVSMDYVFNVTPGTHTFTVCALSDAGITAANSSLALETVAVNGAGGLTRPAALAAAPRGLAVTTHP